MSMLSSMCDKLRTTADEVERIKHNNADWLWRDGVTLMDAVRELRDAADTIDNLRGMCQDVQFENEKLREFARRAYSFSYNCYHGAFDQEVFFDLRDRMRNLGIEVN